MGFTSENKPEKQITMGILAHVDAGKTTLSEGILYTCKAIRKLGRVDHQDAFLDTNTLERNRGITIFSKQAECTLGEFGITLLDTPGHVDFSAEMERTLQVLDYGILVISGADGSGSDREDLCLYLPRGDAPPDRGAGMRSLEDLERAFERGLNAWESGKVLTVAGRMGQKCVREVKRKTPVITGNLRRRWRSSAEKRGNDVVIILENDADYAEAVNNGHRIVSHGKTVGKTDGRHMLEQGVAAYKDTYMADDLQEMADVLKKGMGG